MTLILSFAVLILLSAPGQAFLFLDYVHNYKSVGERTGRCSYSMLSKLYDQEGTCISCHEDDKSPRMVDICFQCNKMTKQIDNRLSLGYLLCGMKEPPWGSINTLLLLFMRVCLLRAQISQDAQTQSQQLPIIFGISVLDENHVVGFKLDGSGLRTSYQVEPHSTLTVVIYGSNLETVVGVTFVKFPVNDTCPNTNDKYSVTVKKEWMEIESSHIVRVRQVSLHEENPEEPFRICIRYKDYIDDIQTNTIFVNDYKGMSSLYTKERETEYYLPFVLQICIILFLLVLSGLFSGLNLGLMALDPTELQLIINSGTKTERRYGEIILPVRKTGNFLLCSLLLGNVLVNSAISILFDDLTSGIVALVVSSFGIVVFGEIVPQSICNRKGLAVGAYTIWLTKFFMLVTSPLSWPISKLLDKILGEEVGRVYDKNRLIELIRMSCRNPGGDREDLRIVTGALEYQEKTVKDVMTNIEDVFMLSSDVKLTSAQVADIVKNGYTRIPVYENDRNNVVSLLNVKDLALLDPDDNLPIKTVCTYWAHPTRFVMEDTPLKLMLDEFMKGHYHLALVQKVEMREDVDNSYVLTGLVTLEDIIEEILQAEIVDETDVITDNRQKHKRKDAQLKDLTLLLETEEESTVSVISLQQQLAAVQWLSSNMTSFSEANISQRVLQRLVKRNTRLEKVSEHQKTAKQLYKKGERSNKFTFILEGRMQVVIGSAGMTFEAGQFHVFGTEVMNKMAELANKFKGENVHGSVATEEETLKMMSRESAYCPDFSIFMDETVTYMTITTEDYWQAFKSTCIERKEKITLHLNLLGSPSSVDIGRSRERVQSDRISPHSDRISSVQLSPRLLRNVNGSPARFRSNSGSELNPSRATISNPREAQKWIRQLRSRKSLGSSKLTAPQRIKETKWDDDAHAQSHAQNDESTPRRSISHELLVRVPNNAHNHTKEDVL